MNGAAHSTIATRLVSLGIAVLAAGVAAAFDLPEAPAWTPEFVGVDSLSVTLTKPRPLRLHALRVDLTAPGVSVATDRSNGDRPLETDGLKTSTFLRNTGCQVAINAAPFRTFRTEEGLPQDIVGLAVADGEQVSLVEERKPRAALVFREGGMASIEWPPFELEGIRHAVSGYGVILRGGAPHRPPSENLRFIRTLHPRTAVGLADNGRTLLLVVVDGRQIGYSEGVGLNELARLLAWLGATDAINLDGGGTSTMVLADDSGGFRLLNRPIHGRVPGQERVCASHLGVFAAPLP